MAFRKPNKLTDRDVRIVYLPPAAVASAHQIGDAPELATGNMLFDFIRQSNLAEIAPGFRHYGFNHPNGEPPYNGPDHGYERWVTIPDGMGVPAPLTKKHFAGGMYAAYMIPIGEWEGWGHLFDWAQNSERYEIVPGDPACMDGALEEHLNAMRHHLWSMEECDRRMQIDLLIPIKEKG